MVVTKDVDLPEEKELNVDEINMSTAALIAGSNYIGKYCESVNNEFMLCRFDNGADPRPCIDLGKMVTKCSREGFMKIKESCSHEFTQFANCIDKSSGDYKTSCCRKTQGVFNECMRNSACYEPPHFGYFTRARIHKSGCLPKRPNPPCPCKPKFDDPTPSLPDCKPRKPARFTSRNYWVTE